MNLVKYQPFNTGKMFGGLVDEIFNRDITQVLGNDFMNSTPAVNILEAEGHFSIQLAAPGLEKENFSLKVDKDVLSLSATLTKASEANEEKFTRREFNFSSFKRVFKLPDIIDINAISATYENGLLIVNLPKKEEAKALTQRTISIN